MNDFLVTFINILAWIFWAALMGRVLLSWLNVRTNSWLYPVAGFLYQITEPILGPIRRVLPQTGMFDFSPIVAILLVQLVRWLFIKVAA